MNTISTSARNVGHFALTLPFVKTRRFMLSAFILLTAILSIIPGSIKAQTVGDYRSIITTGKPILTPWENASSWERFDGLLWVPATVSPNFNDGVITVRTPTYMLINTDLTLDQTIVENGATIQPSAAGATLTINNGAGTDLELNGNAASVWANNHLLNVTSGALINGPSSSIQYRGLTLINNGTINATLNPRPDVASTTISGVGTIATLITSNNGGLFLAGDQTITSLLNFNFGNVITNGTNKIIIATSATVQNNSATNWYVDGNMQMNFPAGNSNKFYRIGNIHTKGAKGTGLGLYLTKKIVEKYKGNITVTNNHPAGTNFEISLKQKK